MFDISDYVLKNFYLSYLIDSKSIDINYDEKKTSKINILRQSEDYFSNDNGIHEFPEIVWDDWNGTKIPFLFQQEKVSEILTKDEIGNVTIHYDIFASIFYFLSGWQEYNSDKSDELGRFPYEASFHQQFNIIEVPIVNYYFDILAEAISFAYGIDKIKTRFSKDNFVTFMSHDIDDCMTGWTQDAFSEFKKGKLFTVLKIVSNRIIGKDSWFTFNELGAFNKARQIRSTYFFIPKKGKNKRYKLLDADYKYHSKKIQKLVKELKAENNEIALHGSLESSNTAKVLKADLDALGHKVKGHRSHFLMYQIKNFASVLSKNKIKYDNSIYFAEHIGFRHSCCYPFFLYNFETGKTSSVLEFPLTIMDATYNQSKYMNLEQKNVLERSKKVISEVQKFSGILGILWHNNYYSDYKYAGWKEVIAEILDYLESEKTSYMNGQELLKEIKA